MSPERADALSGRRAAALGSPVARSLSPVLRTAVYRALGLEGCSYGCCEPSEPHLGGFVAGLGPRRIGLSLRMPLKRAALEIADEIDAFAVAGGAANTLVPGRRRVAYNIDVAGIVAWTRTGHQIGGGARRGRTAQAALAALQELGIADVTVPVRTSHALRAASHRRTAGCHAAHRRRAGRGRSCSTRVRALAHTSPPLRRVPARGGQRLGRPTAPCAARTDDRPPGLSRSSADRRRGRSPPHSPAPAVPVQRESRLVIPGSDARNDSVDLTYSTEGSTLGTGRPDWSALLTELGGNVQVIHTDKAPSHTGPVPQAVEAGGWIYVSALFGADPDSHAIPGDAETEADRLFSNLEAILDAGGAPLTDVVRVGIVMRDLQRDRPVFNAVWARRFGGHRPSRSAIEASDFGRKGENARFMIEVVAYRG